MERQPQSILFVGAQESGKTSLAIKLAREADRKTLFVVPDDGEKKLRIFPLITVDKLRVMKRNSHKARIIFDEDNNNFFRTIRETYFNGALFFDDGMYFMQDRRAEHFRKLLFRTRQSNNDLYFICHGLSEVPASFWTFFSYLVLFRTTDEIDRASYKLPIFEKIKLLKADVDRQAQTNQYAHQIYRLR